LQKKRKITATDWDWCVCLLQTAAPIVRLRGQWTAAQCAAVSLAHTN